MFPDLTRDDVFRLETERLCLRWPRASDARDIAGLVCLTQTASTTAVEHHPGLPDNPDHFILQSRADNSSGRALILVILQKEHPRQPIGLISATLGSGGETELGFSIAPDFRGKGFASEAAMSVVEAVFSLTNAPLVFANARSLTTAATRVLQKCGFTYLGVDLDASEGRDRLQLCNHFALERKTWAKGREGKVVPPMAQQTPDLFVPAAVATRAGG